MSNLKFAFNVIGNALGFAFFIAVLWSALYIASTL